MQPGGAPCRVLPVPPEFVLRACATFQAKLKKSFPPQADGFWASLAQGARLEGWAPRPIPRETRAPEELIS